jgi:type IX secretion system PorP/SprF family membrane protein
MMRRRITGIKDDTPRPNGQSRRWTVPLCILLLAGAIQGAHAQNLNFSQFFNSPLLTNPANTGFIPESDFRVGANYRDQWSNIPVPFRTMSVWGDAQVWRNRFPTGWVGLGGYLLTDKAGSGSLASTRLYASAAYHQMISNYGLISAGFGLGVVNKRVDPSKLTFDDQWNGQFFDNTILTGETFITNNISYLDLQFGLNAAIFPTDNIYIHGGLGVQQLNRPKETFFEQTPGYNRIMDRRYTLFFDGVFKLNDRWILSPGGFYSRQSRAQQLMLGVHANYNLSGNGEHQLIAGVYNRFGDAVIPMVGYQWRNFRFMFSYDATTSPLSNYVNGQGANELSLVHNGYYFQNRGADRQSMCPKF